MTSALVIFSLAPLAPGGPAGAGPVAIDFTDVLRAAESAAADVLSQSAAVNAAPTRSNPALRVPDESALPLIATRRMRPAAMVGPSDPQSNCEPIVSGPSEAVVGWPGATDVPRVIANPAGAHSVSADVPRIIPNQTSEPPVLVNQPGDVANPSYLTTVADAPEPIVQLQDTLVETDSGVTEPARRGDTTERLGQDARGNRGFPGSAATTPPALATAATPASVNRRTPGQDGEGESRRTKTNRSEETSRAATPVFLPWIPVPAEQPRFFGALETPEAAPAARLSPILMAAAEATGKPCLSRWQGEGPEPADAPQPASELPSNAAVALRIARRATPDAALPNRIAPIPVNEDSADATPAPQGPTAYERAVAWPVESHDQTPGPVVASNVRREAPFQAVEPVLPPEPKARPEPLRELSIEIRHAEHERVEVRLLQKSGELHVAVRATDTELASAIRHGLPELARSLEQEGHRVEAWRPGGLVTPAPAVGEAQWSGSDQPAGDSQQQGRWTQPDSDQQRRHRQDAPRWVEDLEGALSEHTGESNGFSR